MNKFAFAAALSICAVCALAAKPSSRNIQPLPRGGSSSPSNWEFKGADSQKSKSAQSGGSSSATFGSSSFGAKTVKSGKLILPADLAALEMEEKPEQKELAPGVTYVKAHFKNMLGDGPVATYWLVIDWKKAGKDISLNIARHPESRMRPTDLAKETKALATVNGTYHETKDPSTPHFQLKVDGVKIPSTYPDSGDGSMAFNRGEMPFIGHFSKDLLDTYENVISGDGVPGLGQPLPDYSDKSPEAVKQRAGARCPRTFAGNDLTNRVTVIGVADGRMKPSIGVNYVEARWLLEKWGCDPKALVSFDGGGSSVMAIRKGGDCEVQSVPSDGYPVSRERRVAEAIQIIDGKSKPAKR